MAEKKNTAQAAVQPDQKHPLPGGAIKSAVSSIIGCMIVYISVTVVFLERSKK